MLPFGYSSKWEVARWSCKTELLLVKALLKNKPCSASYRLLMQLLQLPEDTLWKSIWLLLSRTSTLWKNWELYIHASEHEQSRFSSNPRACQNGKIAENLALIETKCRDVPPCSSRIGVLWDFPKKKEIWWDAKVLKVTEILIGDVLAVGTIIYDRQHTYETEALMLDLSTVRFSGKSLNLEMNHPSWNVMKTLKHPVRWRWEYFSGVV